MKITELARKPQLTEVVLDDEETLKELGEPLTYWTWDRQPMTVFLKLSSLDQNNMENMMAAIRELILDEHGKPVLVNDAVLPVPILLRIINRTVEHLGKI